MNTIVKGLLAGLAGTAAMTLGEKVEQAITGRPSSYVPASTIERIFRLRRRPGPKRVALNIASHWAFGLMGGFTRVFMAQRGMRGPFASFMFTGMRLALDETLENATGVGAPPWTWPRDEQVIDILHKGIYALVTGAVADRLVRGGRAKNLRRWNVKPSALFAHAAHP